MDRPVPPWERVRNILAFPHAWQRPAKTEEWAYERCLAGLPDSRYAQMLCFPWATLIDLQRKGEAARAAFFIDALRRCPPRASLIRATVMQHIYAKDMLPLLRRLGVTDVFWAHAVKGEAVLDGIRVHPFPLYPVCCAGRPGGPWRPPGERRYLYSFVGAYQPGLYLSEARRFIFELPPRPDALVERRGAWHFEAAVYGEQIGGVPRSAAELGAERERAREYAEVLGQSVFSLCPSGSGPNTIRLWESVGLGAIPVVLSDTHRLPGAEAEWAGAAVFAGEGREAVAALPARLERLLGEAEGRQRALPGLWERHGRAPEQGIAETFAALLAAAAR
jgi:hypothetical protein